MLARQPKSIRLSLSPLNEDEAELSLNGLNVTKHKNEKNEIFIFNVRAYFGKLFNQ